MNFTQLAEILYFWEKPFQVAWELASELRKKEVWVTWRSFQKILQNPDNFYKLSWEYAGTVISVQRNLYGSMTNNDTKPYHTL